MSSRDQRLSRGECAVVITVLVIVSGVLVPGVRAYAGAAATFDARQQMTTALRDVAVAYNVHRSEQGVWPHPRGAYATGAYALSEAAEALELDLAVSLDALSVFTFAPGWIEEAGGACVVSAGMDGRVETSLADIYAGHGSGDDLVQVISYRVK